MKNANVDFIHRLPISKYFSHIVSDALFANVFSVFISTT